MRLRLYRRGGAGTVGRLRSGCGHAVTLTVNDLLDGHVGLDVECRTGPISTGMCRSCRWVVEGRVHDPPSRLSDPVAGDHGEDRDRVAAVDYTPRHLPGADHHVSARPTAKRT